MKLCTYIVRRDIGLAPNPFWGYCTLAVCTPNHQGIRLDVGDWVAGFLGVHRGNRFLYAVKISHVLDLDEYHRDQRFAAKKPKLNGTWEEKCGDNFYSCGPNGEWIQHPNRFHNNQHLKEQDTRHPRVFIGKEFWYLGRSAAPVPQMFTPLIGRRGARVNHDPELVSHFCTWVEDEFEPGVMDIPNDNPDILG